MNFSQALKNLTDLGFNPYPPAPRIRIPNAKDALLAGIQHFTGDRAKWLPAYDQIADWLTDNHNKGLLCVGECGLGKTLICCNVLPVLIHHYCHKIVSVYDATALAARHTEAMHDKLLVLDDIGTEPPESIIYGERHIYFNELVDEAEKRGNLLIITSNLRTKAKPDQPSIEDTYGLRTLDRLNAICTTVTFRGKSLRT
jgi:DNA replication protein DnaC